jgi:hypothetical protein
MLIRATKTSSSAPRALLSLLCVGYLFASPSLSLAIQTEPQPKNVTRAKRPNFSKSDWDGIYFENLFEEGLVGERPDAIAATQLGPKPEQSNPAPGFVEAGIDGSAWNGLISRSTIEDEVKAIQKRLAAEVTTPVRFKSDYLKTHQSFSQLSMLFAVISQYQGEIRWKDDAARAQVAFWRAASNSRVGTPQAFESCRSRLELLTEMVRGGKFVGDETAPENFDWANIVDRNPLMFRLQAGIDKLKALTANQGDFNRQSGEVLHESEMIAAIALALTQENMTDADDDSYREFALKMQQAALQVTEGVKSNKFDEVSKAVNGISQSCDACHGEWR